MTPERFGDWSYYPDLLATPVPRYTSYPTAAEFGDANMAEDQRTALRDLRGPASLYLHIPFCEQICWYCGCNTGAANRTHRLTGYLDALYREIELVSRELDPSVRISRIAFGGGSPNAIAPTDFVRLVDALTINFRLENPVLSVELDPRSISAPWFTALRGIGVLKASLGVQTLDPAVQAGIGRVQPIEAIAAAVDGLRKAGINSLNFDLMYGLPGQDDEILARTLEQAVAMGPERIALFGYAHVPHMIPRQKRIDASHLPDQRDRFRMAAEGHAMLLDHGYEAVGFDHFALPHDDLARVTREGTLRRNFQGFTDDPNPVLIGLGASSISAFPGMFVQNEKNAGRYRMLVGSDTLPGRRGVGRTADDLRRGAVIESLLCQGQAELDDQLLQGAQARLQPFLARGLVALDGSTLRFCEGAEPYHRTVAAIFDAYRSEERKFSSAV